MLQQLSGERVFFLDFAQGWPQGNIAVVNVVASAAAGAVTKEDQLTALGVSRAVQNRFRIDVRPQRGAAPRFGQEGVEQSANVAGGRCGP